MWMYMDLLCIILATSLGQPIEPLPFHAWAPTPPMGWNSWDCFATTVTEQQVKANTDYMAEHLKQFGWQYIVVDIQWYEPNATGYQYRPNAKLVMDQWGRLLPAPNRFPSSVDGAGFKPLADYVHSKGLRFGIHLMRGIPRQAVRQNTPIKDTPYRAQDIANINNICPWNPDMYGVDMSKPGAQEYYNSVFDLIASWNVDFVKVDDISRPYHRHQREIEAIRKAIDRTGRPIVLSLSPGETALTAAEHVKRHANMWRISDDFWDNWPAVWEQFARLRNWNQHLGPGYWPDADMLPFGVLEMGRRKSRFTPEEHYTVMTLWCIARSPLMFGGDMTKMDDFTLSLLTNREVIAVNQHSINNRPLFERDRLIAWVADVPGSKDKYLALFNANDPDDGLDPNQALFVSEVIRGRPDRPIHVAADIGGVKKLILVVTTGSDGLEYDHANWIEPYIEGPVGRLRLTDIRPVRATAGWGQVGINKNASGQGLTVEGKPVEFGIGTHAPSVIEFDLPSGYTTFRASAALDRASRSRGSVQFRVYSERAIRPVMTAIPISVALADLGLKGPAAVRDLWAGKDLGIYLHVFTAETPFHGAGLYRIRPIGP